jgi:6,7-dimethyl-8-ribityllumazine synthase
MAHPSSAAAPTSLKGIAPATELDGKGLNIAIVHTQWNKPIIDALAGGARAELERLGVTVHVHSVGF